jgi:hypothetical protein
MDNEPQREIPPGVQRHLDLVVAASDLVSRAGGSSFEVSWDCPHVGMGEPVHEDHACADVVFTAKAMWNGYVIARSSARMGQACQMLAEVLIEGGRCRCGLLCTTDVSSPDRRTWVLSGQKWAPGCDVAPVKMPPDARGSLPRLTVAMNRHPRRAAERQGPKR